MPTIIQIQEKCDMFLRQYFGVDNSPAPTDAPTGLRLVCLGSPEKTVQGQLLCFLYSAGFKAVLECGISSTIGKRNLDITVFNDNWASVCAIELKHFSANQGSILSLLEALRTDNTKHFISPGARLPLIQIGLYTEINSVEPDILNAPTTSPDLGFYRFFRSYYKEARQDYKVKQVEKDFYGARLVSPAQQQ